MNEPLEYSKVILTYISKKTFTELEAKDALYANKVKIIFIIVEWKSKTFLQQNLVTSPASYLPISPSDNNNKKKKKS